MNLRPTDARAFLRSRLHALTLGLGLVTAASFVGRLHWLCDLTTHFRAQYFAAALFLTFGCAALRSYRWAAAAITLALINLAYLVPFYTSPDDGAPPPAEAARLKIVSLNVYAGSSAYGDVIAYLREAKPDFVVLTEFTPDWLAGIQPLAEEYPERHFEARTDAFGIALLSKRPLRDVRLEAIESDTPYVRATCDVDGRPVTLFGVHPPPPMGSVPSRRRNQALTALAGHVRGAQGATIVVGDFNATSWSPHFTDLLAETKLRDSRLGRGLQPSWSMTHPAPLHIPIDHILVSPEVYIFERRTGPKVGSDHRPVEMEFCLRP